MSKNSSNVVVKGRRPIHESYENNESQDTDASDTTYDDNNSEETDNFNEQNKEVQYASVNRSRTSSPDRNTSSNISKAEQNINLPKTELNTWGGGICALMLVIAIFYFCFINNNKVQTQFIRKPTSSLSESIESIKEMFHNQELDIWYDISSAINELISVTPKKPSIVLLFANETNTMDCLATTLAQASSAILHGDDYLEFNPKTFGSDAGEIIDRLNEYPPDKKKVVIIHDILNINAEAIKALHNLCDRINPLIPEAIYILTMKTSNYLLSQKKLQFVENQFYNKLSKSIDLDILMPLITRITDGAIISVQPEPRLKYC
ncbi:hypothetical protein PUN28_002322 [Cardiocondyla obscurior]|uniref:Uncharacterized protein n=1 Tax=Cardiocondyla obscurior TaxID=286306 RepID=A0AAW2GTJ3_9HYME